MPEVFVDPVFLAERHERRQLEKIMVQYTRIAYSQDTTATSKRRIISRRTPALAFITSVPAALGQQADVPVQPAKPCEQYVTDDERAAVYAKARPMIQVAIDPAVLTGLRVDRARVSESP